MFSKKYKICFVSGTRADYSLLLPLMSLVKKDKNFIFQLIITGTHLSRKYGYTIKEIKKDNFKVNYKVKILNDESDSSISVINSTSNALIKIGKCFKRLKPDLVILLGDRYEIFASAIAANFLRIPIAHFHGGEVTEAVIDESLRHSLTKMSSIHFVSNEKYRKRVIQLGENPKNVFNVGAMGIDSIKNTNLKTKTKLQKDLGIKFKKNIFLITFHPVTLENNTSKIQFQNIIRALEKFDNTSFIFTAPNADMMSNPIFSLIDHFVLRNNNASFIKSLGRINYYSLLKHTSVVLGNSSSGVIEAPYFKVPVVDIGDRQKGRVKAKNIINCTSNEKEIYLSINLALSKEFRKKFKKSKGLFGSGNASKKFITIIKNRIHKLEVKKSFYDINFSYE